MRLLPKSIHWCRRYPTKFNSGRDIPRVPIAVVTRRVYPPPVAAALFGAFIRATAERVTQLLIEHDLDRGDVLRSLSKKKMYGSPNSNPSPELGADKENHTSWERYYQVSDCSSSLRNDWYSGI